MADQSGRMPGQPVGRRRGASVRARVTIGAVAVVAVALVVVGIAILRVVGATMVSDAQAAAETQARGLAVLAEVDRLTPRLDVDAERTTILQVVAADGTVLAVSDQLATVPPLGSVIPLDGQSIASTVRVAAGGQSIDYRVVAVGAQTPHGPVAVYAGVALTEADAVLKALTRLVVFGFLAVLAVVAAVAWLVIARALRPVDAIRAEVDGLTDADLDRRVPVPAHRDEVHRLAVTMNRMLARLQGAADRQRTFIADASHELRSPLASLRTQLEVTAAHPEGADAGEVAADALTDVLRLQALADDLLTLAKLDAGQQVAPQQIDVAELVTRLLADRRGDRVPVTLAADGAAVATAVPREVRQIVTNLVDNAVRHAASRVIVTVGPQILKNTHSNGKPTGRKPVTSSVDESPSLPSHRVSVFQNLVAVTVTDDGPGIAAADAERVFERFVRLDPTRSRADGGSGLGLAIARELARSSGGDLVLDPGGPGATFRLILPT